MRRLIVITLVLAASIAGSFAWSQTYPARPIRFVVGFPPGGTADVIARAVAAELQRQMGTNIVVDNRPGAGGMIGYEIVAKAEPDGYTVLCISPSFVASVAIRKKLPFDPRKDFAPMTLFATGVPNVLVVNPAFPGKSIQDLIALARNKDKPVTYGSPGIGSVQHFVAELFNLRAGIRLMHVPYKGQAPALNALLGGEIQVVFLQPPGGVDHIKAGRLRALAFAGSSRWSGLPQVPTVAESGVPEYQLKGPFQGLLAPARIPRDIVTKIHAGMRKALAAPRLREFFSASGWEGDGRGPEEFRSFLNGELKRYAEIARAANIKAE